MCPSINEPRRKADTFWIAFEHNHNLGGDFSCCSFADLPRASGVLRQISLLQIRIRYIFEFMKLWLAFILSFAVTLAGFANAVEAAMPCHSSDDQHTAQSEPDELQSCPTCAHEDHNSHHGRTTGQSHAAKCVSSCCGSLCFVQSLNQFDDLRGQTAYGASRSAAINNTFGLVQERPPKLLG